MSKYSHLIEEVKQEIVKAKEESVKVAIKERVERLEALDQEVDTLRDEIDQLVEDGKIEDMGIKVVEGEQKGIGGAYTFTRGSGSTTPGHIGMSVSM